MLAALLHPALGQPKVSSTVERILNPSFETRQVAADKQFVYEKDTFSISFQSGRLVLAHPFDVREGGQAVAATFKGAGRLVFAPKLPLERQQLTLHSGLPVLAMEFSEAVFTFTDADFAKQLAELEIGAGGSADLEKLYRDRRKERIKLGLESTPRLVKGLLAANPAGHEFLVAELKTKKGRLVLVYDEADPEQIELSYWDDGGRRADLWSKYPKDGKSPRQVFQDPLAHHEYRILGYRIDLTVEKNTDVSAEAEMELDMKRAGERVLLMSLTPSLRVSSVTTAGGKELEFFQPRDPGDDPFAGSYLAIVSDTPFPVGPSKLRFRYGGKGIVRKVGDGNYFCQSFGWYPTFGLGRPSLNANAFAGRYDFDITLRVPKQFKAVAVGNKVESKKVDKMLVTRWKSDIPMAVAGFAYGDYKIHTEKVGEIEVQVYANKRPDDLMRSIEIIAAGGMSKSGSKSTGLTLGSLSPSRLAKTIGIELGNNLRVMENFFGPYPYKKLAVSNIPYSYGQGWPSLIYLSSLSFLDSTQRHQLGIDDHVGVTDFFRAHETSHQWWGHVVGWKSYHDQWLSEGFAQFSGNLYTLFRKDADEFKARLRQDREGFLIKDRSGLEIDAIGPIYAGLRLRSSRHPSGYSRLVYDKGGWVLHMVRMMLFDPRSKSPDQRFIAMMKDFTKTYYNKPASTDDFKTVLEKHMTPSMNLDGNGSMDWFFNSWIHGMGIPEYKLEYRLEPSADGKFLLSGVLHQKRVPDSFRMIVPLYLHQGENMMRLGWLTVAGAETPFDVPLGFKPDKVTICEMNDVLMR